MLHDFRLESIEAIGVCAIAEIVVPHFVQSASPGISRGGHIGRVLDPTQTWVAARACRRRLSIRSFAMSLSFLSSLTRHC